jgi:hypothetical protein
MANRNRKSQPKAWTGGSNPITQRPVNSTNGTQKPQSPVSSPSQHSKHAVETNADKHAHDRALFLFSQFVVRTAPLYVWDLDGYTIPVMFSKVADMHVLRARMSR